MSEVLLALKRDAKTDPPEEGTWAMTDAGPLCRGAKCWFRGYNDPVPDPSVWFDFPRDTERETLTVEDLRRALYCLEDWLTAPLKHGELPRSDLGTSARLRTALDALAGKDTP